MTRKHYVALAQAFARSMPDDETEYNGWSEAVRAVADVLEADNPRFDRLRFLFACASPQYRADVAARVSA